MYLLAKVTAWGHVTYRPLPQILDTHIVQYYYYYRFLAFRSLQNKQVFTIPGNPDVMGSI